MPELPEVETIRLQLAPLVQGRTITDAWAARSPKFSQATAAVGATFGPVRRRGKYLLFDISGGRELVIHLGMTGSLGPGGEDRSHVRAWWRLDDSSTVSFRDIRMFGRIGVISAGDYGAYPTLAALGPEPFDATFTPDSLYEAVNHSMMRVKTQLLQQRVVAGLGNIYTDEALWAAGINPWRRRITRRQADRLHAAVKEALGAGLAHGGTTLRDYRDAGGGEGEHQHHLRCYGRAGLPCEACGRPLIRRVIDGRSSTYCPVCQPSR